MNKVALITGGSSGIGASVARMLADSGCRVYEISRREHSAEGVTHITGDVSDEASIGAAVEKVALAEGRIDILICCAGYGISGAAEFTDMTAAAGQIIVNLLGTANAVKAVIPQMRRQGGGRIITVSSVAAVTPIAFQSWYSASKAAINAYIMALDNEIRRFGISVCAVMPGDTNTGFTDARKKTHVGDDIYGGAISKSVAYMEKNERKGVPPEKVAKVICRAALKKKVRLFYTVGLMYKAVVWLARLLPPGLLNRLIALIYR